MTSSSVSAVAVDSDLNDNENTGVTEVTKIMEENQDFSESFEGLKKQGNKLFAEQNYGAALEKYAEALVVASDNKEKGAIFHNQGVTYEGLKNDEAALGEYAKALEMVPDYYKVLKRRAKLYLRLKEFEKARLDVKDVLFSEKKGGGNATYETSQIIFEVLEQLGFAYAEKALENISSERKTPRKEEINIFFRAFINDPVSLLWKGKQDAPLIEDAPPDRGYLAAVKALKAREYEAIFGLCDDEIKNPSSGYLYDAYFLRGTLKLLWGYGRETLEDFENIMNAKEGGRIDNKLKSSAALKMALFYWHRTTQKDKIEEYFDLAETLWKGNCDVYHNCAMMMVEEGKPDKAEALLNEAIKVFKGDEYPIFFQVFKLAVTYCMETEKNNREKMETTFTKLQELEPSFDSPECYDVYANALLLQTKTKEAEELYIKAIASFPEYPSFHLKKALAHYWKIPDKFEECLAELKKILEIDDRYNVLYFHIGATELRLGNYDKGLQNLKKCIELTRNIDEAAERATIMLEYELHIELCEKLGISPWDLESGVTYDDLLQ